MKRSVQEIVELLVFGLLALLVGTGLLWLVGWIFDLVGVLFKFFAGLIWSLLRFIVPVAVVAAVVYGLVRLLQNQGGERGERPGDSPPDRADGAIGREPPAAPAGPRADAEPPPPYAEPTAADVEPAPAEAAPAPVDVDTTPNTPPASAPRESGAPIEPSANDAAPTGHRPEAGDDDERAAAEGSMWSAPQPAPATDEPHGEQWPSSTTPEVADDPGRADESDRVEGGADGEERARLQRRTAEGDHWQDGGSGSTADADREVDADAPEPGARREDDDERF